MFHPASSIASQIRSNHIPQSAEMGAISEVLLRGQERITRYDEEISRLHLLVAKLEGQREQLRQIMTGYTCLQAPVRRVPTELLVEIFSYCSGSESENSIVASAGLSPLNLARVCVRWRDIVLSAKRLWTNISLDLKKLSFRGNHFDQGAALRLCLSRSGGLPLSLDINDRDLIYRPRHRVLSELARESRRWYRVKLSLDKRYYQENGCLSSIRRNLPLLEELTIDGDCPDTNIFNWCPKLRHLSSPAHPSPQVPWGQLSSLRISGTCSASQAVAMLGRCTQLVQFALDLTRLYPDGRPQPISSHIHSMTIDPGLHRTNTLVMLFDALTLPSLKSFSINEGQAHQSQWWPHASFIMFLLRSSCKLETLQYDGHSMTAAQLLQALELLPTLLTLKVIDRTGRTITKTLLQRCTYDANSRPPSSITSPALLPRLTHIDMRFADSCNRWDQSALVNQERALLGMLESRWLPGNGVACLECASVTTYGRKLKDLSLYRIGKLASEGLKITLNF